MVQPTQLQQIGFQQERKEEAGGHNHQHRHKLGILEAEQMLEGCEKAEQQYIQEKGGRVFHERQAEGGGGRNRAGIV